MEILLFTTNIQHADLARLRALLEGVSGIVKWTVDLEDCDHVLRVVGHGVCSDMLQRKLNEVGFECQRMLDS